MKKIFVLDDNVELIEIVELVLGKEFVLHTSLSVEHLSEQVMEFQPNLMLIDHYIGKSNSTEVVEHLKAEIPGFNTPIVLFSASNDIADKAMSLGAVGYIAKPFSIHDLKSYIRQVLENNAAVVY